MNKNLISFIGGAVFAAAVMPFISEAVTVISSLSECIQTKIARMSYGDAKKLQDLQAQVEKQNTFAIGFCDPDAVVSGMEDE